MGSPYTPSPVRLTPMMLIDDGDPKDAAGINVPIECVADGTEYATQLVEALVERTRAATALNWHAPITTSGSTPTAASYAAASRSWLLVDPGNSKSVYKSIDHGLSWASLTSALPSGTLTCHTVAQDNDGRAVIAAAGSGARALVYDGSSWTNVAVNAAETGEAGRIVFNGALWCYAYLTGDFVRIYTSPDRTTWTMQSAPSSLANVQSHALLAHPSTGRLIWIGRGTSGAWMVSTSDDDGESWTSRTAPSHSGTWGDGVNASIDEASGRVYLPIVSSGSTYVYRSDTVGETFSLVGTVGAALARVAAQGEIVVGTVATDGSGPKKNDLVYSTTRGASWKKAGIRLDADGASLVNVFAGGGGFIAAGAGKVWRSLRMGDPGWPI